MKEFTRSARDEMIEYVYNQALSKQLMVYQSDTPDYRYKPDMSLYVEMVYTYDDEFLRVMLRHPTGRTIFISYPNSNKELQIINKGPGFHLLNLDRTEEECFQESLVTENAVEYTILQQINFIINYGLAVYEDNK